VKTGRKKLYFSEVKNRVENQGLNLVSKTYIKSNKLLKVRCSKGHTFERSLFHIEQSNKCPICKFPSLEEIKTLIESKHCKLLTNKSVKHQEPLKIKCKCGRIFYRSFSNYKKTGGLCSKCAGGYPSKKEIIEAVKNKNLRIIKSGTPLKVQCKECKHKFEINYRWLLEVKEPCIKCRNSEKPSYKFIISHYKKQGFKVLTKKEKCQQFLPIKLRCKNGHILKRKLDLSTKKVECKKCRKNSKIKILKEKEYNVVKYTKNKITFLCPICNNKFKRTFKGVLASKYNLCKSCSYKKEPPPTKHKFSYVKKEVKKRGCKLLSKKYINAPTPLLIQCKCGNIFTRSFMYWKKGHYYCISCVKKNPSKGERSLQKFVSKFNVPFETNNRTILSNNFELDIYVPSCNLAIEYNGLYWHSDTKLDKNYHLDKTTGCLKKGIQLLHIFEDEWLDPVKRKIWKSIIRNKLGKSERIFGRKCEIKEVSSNQSNKFLERNHLQGKCNSSVRVGLFYNDKLVSLATFGKPRFSKNYDWEIIRISTKRKYLVIGGVSKLWKYFLRTYFPKSCVSYADRRTGEGTVYNQLNFSFLRDSQPNYFYVDDTYSFRQTRNKYQKHKLHKLLSNFNPKLSEKENMKVNGYHRVYDSGNKVYTFSNF